MQVFLFDLLLPLLFTDFKFRNTVSFVVRRIYFYEKYMIKLIHKLKYMYDVNISFSEGKHLCKISSNVFHVFPSIHFLLSVFYFGVFTVGLRLEDL